MPAPFSLNKPSILLDPHHCPPHPLSPPHEACCSPSSLSLPRTPEGDTWDFPSVPGSRPLRTRDGSGLDPGANRFEPGRTRSPRERGTKRTKRRPTRRCASESSSPRTSARARDPEKDRNVERNDGGIQQDVRAGRSGSHGELRPGPRAQHRVRRRDVHHRKRRYMHRRRNLSRSWHLRRNRRVPRRRRNLRRRGGLQRNRHFPRYEEPT